MRVTGPPSEWLGGVDLFRQASDSGGEHEGGWAPVSWGTILLGWRLASDGRLAGVNHDHNTPVLILRARLLRGPLRLGFEMTPFGCCAHLN